MNSGFLLESHSPVRTLDFLLRGIARDTKNFIRIPSLLLLFIGIPFPLRLGGRETRSRHLSPPKANLQALTLIALGAKESNTSTRSEPRREEHRSTSLTPSRSHLESRHGGERDPSPRAPPCSAIGEYEEEERAEEEEEAKRARGFGERGEGKERVGFPLLPMNSAAVTLSLYAHASRGNFSLTSTADAA